MLSYIGIYWKCVAYIVRNRKNNIFNENAIAFKCNSSEEFHKIEILQNSIAHNVIDFHFNEIKVCDLSSYLKTKNRVKKVYYQERMQQRLEKRIPLTKNTLITGVSIHKIVYV